MQLVKITDKDSSVLRHSTRKFTFERNLSNTFKRMNKIMRDSSGCGIAATQVGLSERFFVAEIDNEVQLIINPVITKKHGQYINIEACLSIPNQRFMVPRFHSIEVRYQTESGEFKIYSTNCSKTSAIFQHEIDHLDGILIDDYCLHKSRQCYCNYVKNRDVLSVEDIMKAQELKDKLSFGDLFQKFKKYILDV